MDLFQRYEESLTAYNRAAGLIDRGDIGEAEPLLREALASYPRQALMEGPGEADEEIRKTLDSLFDNIRSKLIEIDRRRASQRDVSGESAGTLQSIVERNVTLRRPAFQSDSTRGDAFPAEPIPDEPREEREPLESEEYAPPVEVVEIPMEEDSLSGVDFAPAEETAPLEAEPSAAEIAEIEPAPVRERPSPTPQASRPSDEVEELLHAVDSIRETDEIVSEDDYRVSDEVFLAGPIDEDDGGEVLEPLPAHIEEPLEERGNAGYTWTEEDEDVILKTGGRRPSGSFFGGLMEKTRSFFRREKSPGKVQDASPARTPEFEQDAGLPGEQEPAGEEALKGTDMEQDMESSESTAEKQPSGKEEVLSAEEMREEEELTPAEELLIEERRKEEAAKKPVKKGFLTGLTSLFSKKSGGAPAARKKKPAKKKKGARKKKAGLFSMSVSAASIVLILLLMGAALALVSMYPIYTKTALLNRIDMSFTNGDIDAATKGYIKLAQENGDQRVFELISESAAARARTMISAGEAPKAIGMLRPLLAGVVSDDNLRVLLVDAYVTKAVAAAGSGDTASAKNMIGLIETEMKLLPGGVPPGVSAKYSRLRALITEKKPE